jgi:hypothetical protein
MARNFVSASSQYLEDTAAAITTYPCTLAGWFRISSGQSSWVLDFTSLTTITYIYLTATSSVVQIGVRQNGGTTFFANSTAGPTLDTWQHAAGTLISDSSRAAYLNGANKGTSATTSTEPTGLTRSYVGARRYGSGPTENFGDGDVAEAGAWNVALSDAEIASLGAGASPLMVRPASLVAYWPLIGRTSPEPAHVGDFAMTLNGAPVWAEHPPVYYPVPDFSATAPAAVTAVSVNISPGANYVQVV